MVREGICRNIELERGRSCEQSFEGDSCLQPCERGTQAQMNAPTESDMATRSCSFEIDLSWAIKCSAVVIGRGPDKDETSLSRKAHTGELRVFGHPAIVAPKRRIDPTGLLDEAIDSLRVSPKIFLEALVRGQDRSTGTDEARRRLAASRDQQQEDDERFHVIEVAGRHGPCTDSNNGVQIWFGGCSG